MTLHWNRLVGFCAGLAVTTLNAQGTFTYNDRIEYSAYGMTAYRTGTNDTPFLYNGIHGVQTDGNGLLHMRARYYNPYLCRFVNPDPAGFSGGLNLYAYADGNPVSKLDPLGLGAVGESIQNAWVGNAQFDSMLSGPSIVERQRNQEQLVGAVQLLSFGLANPVAALASGYDLGGDYVHPAEAFEQTLQASANLALLAISLPIGGTTAEAGAVLRMEGTMARRQPMA